MVWGFAFCGLLSNLYSQSIQSHLFLDRFLNRILTHAVTAAVLRRVADPIMTSVSACVFCLLLYPSFQPRMFKGLVGLPHPVFEVFSIPTHPCMPRRPLLQNTAALEEGKAALAQSLKAVNARLRQERKAAWARRNHELSARRHHVQQAVAVLLLHDSDRCWLPAFMRRHGMSGMGEELAAFDDESSSIS